MSLAPSVAVPRTSFNPLPLYIGLFCLLWSFAFVAGKIGVTDCPPLILLTARFSLAGILILGISALRGEGFDLTWRDAAVFSILGVANNALYLGLGYTGLQTVSAGLGGLVVSANPVFTAVLAAVFLGETLTYYGLGKPFADVAEPIPGPSTEYFGRLARKHNLQVPTGLGRFDGLDRYRWRALTSHAAAVPRRDPFGFLP